MLNTSINYWLPIGFADVLERDSQTRVIYQWLRWEQLSQWWHWILLLVIVALVFGHAVSWYRRDWVDLARPAGLSLLVLRLAAFSGILLYFFHLEKRTEQLVVRDSKVAILVDTSISMTAPGTPSPSGVPSDTTRTEEVAKLFSRSSMLEQLSDKHQVNIYRFDQSSRPVQVASLSKRSFQGAEDSSERKETDSGALLPFPWARNFVLVSVAIMAVAIAMIVVSLSIQLVRAERSQIGGWLLLLGSSFMLLALALSAIGIVPNTNYTLRSLFGGLLAEQTVQRSDGDQASDPAQTSPTGVATGPTKSLEDWLAAFNPTGIESRIGDAIKSILDRELGNPLAGIVLFTDGRNNAGIDPKVTLAAAQNARVPIYVVGVGSEKRPSNIQLVELDAPKRLYPGDRFSVSALFAAAGFEGRTVNVQFFSGRPEESLDRMQLEGEAVVEIPADGSLATAKVELPPKSVGKWIYAARATAFPGESDTTDNQAQVEVEVIERRNRVLVCAGGPLREYQFARNLLYRDKDVESHVYLQSGGPATSQEAQKIVAEFPQDLTSLSEYDAVLAFDLDWTRVSEKSVQALERWVGEQAGGLFLLAGSVETPKWLARSSSGLRSQLLRDLSPVVLDMRGSALLAAGRVEGESPWPLTFTPDGRQMEFLWLTDEPISSFELWQTFPGVHTFYSAYELKPGAKALALFSDPSASAGGQQPIYLASQFYGAGRVVFQGGGEMWRLRGLGDQYFDRYYTKLVRWISQGRLLLDSDRGVLLVDRDEAVQGEQVSVRAVLKNELFEPLVQSEVVARLIDPQGLNVPLVLRPLADGTQPGVYSGSFPVLIPGVYRLQLQLGGLASDQFLQSQVLSRIPKLEMQSVERNDVLLGQLASETGGIYWIGCTAAGETIDGTRVNIASAIAPQDQVAYAPGTPDREFQLRWLGWLMTWIASSLSLEWLSRRVHRLA